MAGNTFGEIFRVTTCGESHGEALAAIIDGCPPQIDLSEEDIQPLLDRRRPGSTRYGTPRNEGDKVKIISGVFEGKTTGTPIGLIISNTSQRSQDYGAISRMFRPGHADYTYLAKYGIRDYRGGGRASARETAMRVAAGAVAIKVLSELFNVTIAGCVTAIGPLKADCFDQKAALESEFNFADPSKTDELKALFKDLAVNGDSVGAVVEVRASGVPAGWGSPVFDRLDAAIASALMGINAVKGVEIGDGFAMAAMRGTQARDEIRKDGFCSNHSGGILGGISSGQIIKARMALKPTSSILSPGRSLDVDGNEVDVVTRGRHDPCVGVRAVPIAEAMLALVLLDAAMMQQAQCFNVKSVAPKIPSGSL
ncbi:MAG: chorismate synthase [Succinatimonas hippei]|nr:chorismate synthase [Succinatimonas hippei]